MNKKKSNEVIKVKCKTLSTLPTEPHWWTACNTIKQIKVWEVRTPLKDYVFSSYFHPAFSCILER